ncbi:Receptor-type tyrosine-protein phosphatase H, partial [Araneus ventricosus]
MLVKLGTLKSGLPTVKLPCHSSHPEMCCGGLVVRSRLQSGRVPGSKLYSTEDPPWFGGFVHLKKHLKGRHFRTDTEVQEAIVKWLRDLDPDFFYAGFDKLVCRWHICFNNHDDYVEKSKRAHTWRLLAVGLGTKLACHRHAHQGLRFHSGPNEHTLGDFWRLVWEQNSHVIVMLTKVFDFIRVMCDRYWPIDVDHPESYGGDIQVTLLSETTLANYNIRTMQLKKGEEVRQASHLHYVAWPTHTNPFACALLDFRRRVKSYIALYPNNGPLIVHC